MDDVSYVNLRNNDDLNIRVVPSIQASRRMRAMPLSLNMGHALGDLSVACDFS